MSWDELLAAWGQHKLDDRERLGKAKRYVNEGKVDQMGDTWYRVGGRFHVEVPPAAFPATCTCNGRVDVACSHQMAVAMHIQANGIGQAPVTAKEQIVMNAIGKAIGDLADVIQARHEDTGNPVLIIGPTGTGKTSAVEAMVEALNYGFEEVAGSRSWTEADLIGCYTPARDWVQGPIGRAFERARNGEKIVMFVDEITRFNPRTLDILLKMVQPKSAELARRQGLQIPAGVEEVYLVEVPMLGKREWAPVENLIWVAAGNPGVNPLDPALLRRFEPIWAWYDSNVLAAFPQDFRELVVDSLWPSAKAGALPLPLEYQALLAVDETAILQHYVYRLAALDELAAESVALNARNRGFSVKWEG